MKHRIFSLVLLLVLGSLSLQAQQYDVMDQVRADIRKTRGHEGPHRLNEIPASLTEAPKGYKPFYLSHYGRHGSRYCWDAKVYSMLRDVFTKAQELEVLTPYGQEFAQKYLDFYKIPSYNTGDLASLGYEEHQQIGQFVYKQFPEVFQENKRIDALSSTSGRCIVSMGAFIQGLTGGNAKLTVHMTSNHVGMCIIAPPNAPKALRRHFKGENEEIDLVSPKSYKRNQGVKQIVLDKLFTDTEFLKDIEGAEKKFVGNLLTFCGNYHNFEPEPIFDDLITDEQRVISWEISNYGAFHSSYKRRYTLIPLLEDIVFKADAALANPEQAANLRFGHDYIFGPLMCLLRLNSCDTVPSKPEDVVYWYQNYNVCMAATVLFVFYKNDKGDVLFKVLLNEHEATLPQIQAVQGPYYRWSDFRAWAQEVLDAHPDVN